MTMFEISPPWYRESEVEHIAFNGFAFETEERKEKINQFISLLSKVENPNDPQLQYVLFRSTHLDPFSLTPLEQTYIESEVSKLL